MQAQSSTNQHAACSCCSSWCAFTIKRDVAHTCSDRVLCMAAGGCSFSACALSVTPGVVEAWQQPCVFEARGLYNASGASICAQTDSSC
jgi:hypothetical protein